jgi:SAM-dependent methyltransferase
LTEPKPANWRAKAIRRYYNPEDGWVNGTARFHSLCRSVCPVGGQILEVGAGAPNKTSRLLSTIGEVHGVDPDPVIRTNSLLATSSVITDDQYPFPSNFFDACVSDYVLEHVRDPVRHLHEVRRVLKPGAPYVFRTPNRWHYVYAAAALTPHVLHLRLANRLRALPAEAPDPYPTFYRMNSTRAIRRLAGTRWRVELLSRHELEPAYGMVNPVLFYPFMAYERTVNSTEWLAPLRSTLLVVLRTAK